MLIYISVFIITALLVKAASFYRTLYKGTDINECIIKDNNICLSDIAINSSVVLDKKQLMAARVKYYVFFWLAVLPLFFISAVRYDIGTDYNYTYVPNFYTILNGGRAYSEYGFYLFNKLIQLFTDNPQWLFVITSFIFSFFFIRTILHCSVSPAMSVVILFCSMIFFWSMNNVRQAIAVVLIFAAFPHLVKRHTVRYLIYVIAAFVFHITALGMIIPYIIVRMKYVRRYFIYAVILTVILLPIICDLAVYCIETTKYSYFLYGTFNTGSIEVIRTWLNLGLFVVAYAILHRYAQSSVYVYALLVMQFFAFLSVAFSYFIGIPEMWVRLMNYFQICQVLLIPYCAKRLQRLDRQIIIYVAYILTFGMYNTQLVLNGDHEVIPYKWIFGVN